MVPLGDKNTMMKQHNECLVAASAAAAAAVADASSSDEPAPCGR